MTKTQISVRVSPDTLAAIDAAAQVAGTSRGHIIDRWLAAQAASKPVPLIRLGLLIEQARTDTGAGELASALHIVCDVLDVLAGTEATETECDDNDEVWNRIQEMRGPPMDRQA